jgi:hypothetical protein
VSGVSVCVWVGGEGSDAPGPLHHSNRAYSDGKGAIAHAAVSRRPPISLDTIVARAEGYTYAAKGWDFSLVQGPFHVAPCRTLERYDSLTF